MPASSERDDYQQSIIQDLREKLGEKSFLISEMEKKLHRSSEELEAAQEKLKKVVSPSPHVNPGDPEEQGSLTKIPLVDLSNDIGGLLAAQEMKAELDGLRDMLLKKEAQIEGEKKRYLALADDVENRILNAAEERKAEYESHQKQEEILRDELQLELEKFKERLAEVKSDLETQRAENKHLSSELEKALDIHEKETSQLQQQMLEREKSVQEGIQQELRKQAEQFDRERQKLKLIAEDLGQQLAENDSTASERLARLSDEHKKALQRQRETFLRIIDDSGPEAQRSTTSPSRLETSANLPEVITKAPRSDELVSLKASVSSRMKEGISPPPEKEPQKEVKDMPPSDEEKGIVETRPRKKNIFKKMRRKS